jgi:hypothetical protein
MEYVFPIVAEFVIQYLYGISFYVKPDKQIFVVAVFHKAIITGCGKNMLYIFLCNTIVTPCLKAASLQTISGFIPHLL